MNVTFLGTGAGMPSKNRNVTSILLDLRQELNEFWMFDCGEASQHQILHTTVSPRKINKIFITHLHGDHIFGLPGFLSSRAFQAGREPVFIYGPKGIREFVETSLEISGTRLSYSIYFKELEEGLIFEDSKFKVYCKKLDHGITSYGFRMEEKDLPGRLLVDRLKKDNILPGPVYQQIKENDFVTLPSGEEIDTSPYIDKPRKGRVIVLFGDTRYNEEHIAFAQNATLLIHEATFSKEQGQLARDYFHSTTIQAAHLAKEARVKRLIITHISARFHKSESNQLLQEAQSVFTNTQIANDLDEFFIKTTEVHQGNQKD